MFTDASVRCEGPIRPGPSLSSGPGRWTTTPSTTWRRPTLADEIRHLDGHVVPDPARAVGVPRLVPPPGPRACRPTSRSCGTQRAVDLRDVDDDARDGRQTASCSPTATSSCVDVVVLALGHLDAEPGPSARRLRRVRRRPRAGVPAARSHRRAGPLGAAARAPTSSSLGFGQAFTDLLILVTEGRGGRFVDAARRAASTTSRAAGSRCIHVGSRAACPTGRSSTTACRHRWHPSPTSSTRPPSAPCWPAPSRSTSARDLFPLVAKEAGWAYYHELFNAHPERTASAGRRSRRATRTSTGPTGSRNWSPPTVPDPADRFDIDGPRPTARRAVPRVGRLVAEAPRRAHRRRRQPGAPTRPTAPISAPSWACCSASAPSAASARRAGYAPVAGGGPRRLVVQLLHVLRQRTAAGPPPPVPGARRRRPAAVHRRRHRRQLRPGTRSVRGRAARAIPTRSSATPWSTPASPAVGQPHRRPAAAPPPRARRGARGGRHRRRLVDQHRQGRRHRRRSARRRRPTDAAIPGATPSVCSPTGPPPAPSPARTPTPPPSARTTSWPDRSSRTLAATATRMKATNP